MMEPAVGKPSFLRNVMVRLFLFCVFIIALRFAYVVTIRGESCDVADFCFFSLPESFNVVSGMGQLARYSSLSIVSSPGKTTPSNVKKVPDLWATEGFKRAVRYYSSVFQDLLSDAVLTPNFKALCVDTPTGADVFALREVGVEDSIGIFKKAFKPLVISGQGFKQPFLDESLDFVFCGGGVVEKAARPGVFAAETGRTLKSKGFLVIHTAANDTYSFESLLGLFSFCRLVKRRSIGSLDSKIPFIDEIIFQKISGGDVERIVDRSAAKCSVPGYKRELLKKAELLIEEEPMKPWITLKRNAQKIKYLSSMVDISFRSRYIYVDVGARSYGSSIVSWFKKQYPKQNKTFDIYAIEADKTFHDEYKYKKGVTLLPYAAWIRNESLFFEINEDPGHKKIEKGRGMGRIQPIQSSASSSSDVDEIKGFDFADWLKDSVSERDYVVMKMDVEGTEFDLIPRLFKTGGICLIDELFLECHYNRWQKCCPGERTSKYQKTYGECLELFTSLRKSGVLVHQWW